MGIIAIDICFGGERMEATRAGSNKMNVFSLKGAYLLAHKVDLKDKTKDSREKFVKEDISKVKANDSDEARIANEIKRLQEQENNVISHERSHMQSGGEFSGSPSYLYTRGPDGKVYISGGEVKMYVPATDDYDKLIQSLQKVKRAAMAPPDPSPQDSKTAAMASAKEASVRQEIAKMRAKEAYEKNKETMATDESHTEVHAFRKFKFQEFKNFTLFV